MLGLFIAAIVLVGSFPVSANSGGPFRWAVSLVVVEESAKFRNMVFAHCFISKTASDHKVMGFGEKFVYVGRVNQDSILNIKLFAWVCGKSSGAWF